MVPNIMRDKYFPEQERDCGCCRGTKNSNYRWRNAKGFEIRFEECAMCSSIGRVP